MEEINTLLDELKEQWISCDLPLHEKLEKLRAFVGQLSQDESLTDTDIDELLGSISNTDFAGKRLRLELAAQLKRPDLIVDTIKNGEYHLVRRALAFKWVYSAEVKSELTEPDLLRTYVLPVVSYTTRHKIIKGLSKYINNEDVGQTIFSNLAECFGMQCAAAMLPACNPVFIREQLIDLFGDNRLHPSDTILRRVAYKDASIAVDFLKLIFCELRDKVGNHSKLIDQRQKYGKTLNYLWSNCPVDVWHLFDSFDVKILPKMSWPAVKSLLTADPTLVIASPKFPKLLPLGKRHLVAPLMGDDFPSFFSAQFPEEMEQFPGHIPQLFLWLQGIPRGDRFPIFSTTFRDNYRCDIFSQSEFISPQIMEIIPESNREAICRAKIDTGELSKFGDGDSRGDLLMLEAYWYSFMGIQTSLPILTDILVEQCDAKRRPDVIHMLVYTCYINRDVDALAEVCSLICTTWPTGHTHLREKFLQSVNSTFGYNFKGVLSTSESLKSFLQLTENNPETVDKHLLEAVVLYNLKTAQPIDTMLNIMISSRFTAKWGAPNWDFLRCEPHLHKIFLREATAQMCHKFPWEEGDLLTERESQWIRIGIVTLCETFSKWNHRCRRLASKDPLSVTEFPWLVCRLREILMTPSRDLAVVQLQHRVIKAIQSDKKIRQGYFQAYIETCPLAPVVTHFVTRDPHQLRNQLGSIQSYVLKLDGKLFKTFEPFYTLIKTHCYPHYGASLIEHSLDVVHDDGTSWNERRNAVEALATLFDCTNYLKLLTAFYPDDDMELEEIIGVPLTHTNFRIRSTVVKSLGRVSMSVEELPDCFQRLLTSCVREDYFHTAINPMTTMSLHGCAKEAVTFLRENLLDSDIILRRHAIRLVSMIAERTPDFQDFFVECWENESHHTLRETIVTHMFHHLGNHPTADNWSLLKGTLDSLVGDDKEILRMFSSLEYVIMIPLQFLPDYFLTCLEKFPEGTHRLQGQGEFKAAILEIVNSFVVYLPTDFMEHLLSTYLFRHKEPELVQSHLIMLAASYCIKQAADLPSDGVIASSLIKLSQGERWDHSRQSKRIQPARWKGTTSASYPARQCLHTFVSLLCFKSWSALGSCGDTRLSVKDARTMFAVIIAVIEKHFNRQDAYTVWLYLRCAKIFCSVHSHYTTTAGHPVTKELREEGCRLLTDAGLRFQRLLDDQVKHYGPYVLHFIRAKICEFFTQVVYPQEEKGTSFLDKERIVYFIDGLLKPLYGSTDTDKMSSQAGQILAIKMLPQGPPQSMYFRRQYADCQEMVTKLCGRTTRIFLSDRYSTRF